jgi:tetratricopeptide (TPR) repeat protein
MSYQTRVRELLRDAKAAQQRGNLKAAAEILEQARALAPDHIPTLRLLGALSLDQGEWDRSIDLAKAILAQKDTYASAYSLLGHAYRGLGKTALECESFLKAAKLKPTSARYVLAGAAAYRVGDDALAVRCYRDALGLDPNDDEALLNLAILLRISDSEEAERLLRRALSQEPGSAPARRELGFVLAHTRRLSEAQTVLTQSLALEDNLWTRLYLAITLWDLGDTEASEHEFAKAHEMDPSLDAFEFLARAYERRGDSDTAKMVRQRAKRPERE